MKSAAFVTTVLFACQLAVAANAAAQSATPLQAGLEFYAAASYEDALTALDAARATELSLDERIALEQHRMLCLLALGRGVAADAAATSLLKAKPDFLLTANDASPRVRATFDQARRRVLPSVVRERYAEAKQLFDSGAAERAHASFTSLAALLDTPAVVAADPSFADLRTLVEGFRQLTAPAVATRVATPEPAAPLPTPLTFAPSRPGARRVDDSTAILALVPPTVQATTASAAAAASPGAAARAFAPIDIFTYDARDTDVVPPVVVSQNVQGWWGSMGEPAAGTTLGAVDVVVDETGGVADVRIAQSVNRIYDAALLSSAKQWRFKPAVKNGRAVKYRRVTNVVSGR